MIARWPTARIRKTIWRVRGTIRHVNNQSSCLFCLTAKHLQCLCYKLFVVDSTWYQTTTNEPRHDKTNKVTVRPAKTQISLGIRMKKHWILSYPVSAQRRLWSDWAGAKADLRLRLAHMPFCLFCHVAAQMYVEFDPSPAKKTKQQQQNKKKQQNKNKKNKNNRVTGSRLLTDLGTATCMISDLGTCLI